MVAQIPIDEAKIAAFCRKWNIRELSLFGSVLRGDFNPKSDVDVMLTPNDPDRIGLDQWLDMIEDLKQIFGREVDLHSRESIEEMRNPFRRREILSTAQVVHHE